LAAKSLRKSNNLALYLNGNLALYLNGFTRLSDAAAKSLSKKFCVIELRGLTSITDKQAKSLRKVKSLSISKACQPLIAKYRKQLDFPEL
jgi:hypothetical protein